MQGVLFDVSQFACELLTTANFPPSPNETWKRIAYRRNTGRSNEPTTTATSYHFYFPHPLSVPANLFNSLSFSLLLFSFKCRLKQRPTSKDVRNRNQRIDTGRDVETFPLSQLT